MALPDLHSAAAGADLARLRQHWWLNKHRINGYNRDKQTPLHLACINGHADIVQFLVEKKCKLNPCDKLNKSPLMKAVEHQHGDCAAILLEHGANHNHRGVSGNTALHFAVVVSSKSLVELLLEHGADINAKNNLGYTPLTLAITENCEEMVEFLLQKGADMNAQDNINRSPLTIATVSGNKKAVQLLLQYGAVFPESDTMRLYTCQIFPKMVQNDVFADEQIGSSSYETTPVIPLETPPLAESCDVPKEEEAEKEDSGPATNQNKVSVHSIAAQHYRGDYKAEGAEKKEDKHSLCNPEVHSLGEAVEFLGLPGFRTYPKGQRKVWASVWLPAANSNRLDARSAAVERGKGVLPAAPVEAEDSDSSWGSEPFSKIVEVFASEQRPAADCKGVGVGSAAAEHSKEVLQPAGGAGEDDDSSWDSETGSEGEGKVSAAVQLPAANSSRLDVCSAAVEPSKGVLKQARREAKKEDGVLQPAGGEAKQEENDFSWDSETDSEGQREVSVDMELPAADENRVEMSSAAVELSKAARAEQKEHFISSSENKLPTLQGEDLQLKVDSSTQTDSEQDEQPLARQKLDKIFKKKSLEGAPLGAVKTNSQKEQKLLLEKLERCKSRLKDLKEPLNKNDYYAESVKNALKEKKVITILRNMQGRLVDSFDSSAAAVPQLEERIQRLQIQMAKLEATIQQQVKTIEVFEGTQQISNLSKLVRAFPVHDPRA